MRDSSLVGVKRVTVVGASGAEAVPIRAALTAAGRKMTTLDVDESMLRRAVSRYPVVKDLQVSTQFPHGLKIKVVEQIPVAVLTAGARRIVVAGDGTLLRDIRPSSALPEVSVRGLPAGRRLKDRHVLAVVSVLGTAPYRLLPHIADVTTNAPHGVVVDLRHGPSLYFGDPRLLRSKWTAAVGVLADAGSTGASYIDVVDPERPAAGSLGSGSDSPSSAAGSTASAAGSATSAAGSTASAAGSTASAAGSTASAAGSTASAAGSTAPGATASPASTAGSATGSNGGSAASGGG
jgi:cell division protein FtsQ